MPYSTDYVWEANRFYNTLRSLNKNIFVKENPDGIQLNGLYVRKRTPYGREVKHVGGIDKRYIPFFKQVDEFGHIEKSGVKRSLNALLAVGALTRDQIRNLYPCFFEMNRGEPNPRPRYESIQKKAMKEVPSTPYQDTAHDKVVEPPKVLDSDIIHDVAQTLREHDTDEDKLAEDKMNFKERHLTRSEKIFA